MELKRLLFCGAVIAVLASAAMALPKTPPGAPENPTISAPLPSSKATRVNRSFFIVDNGPGAPATPATLSPLLDCDSNWARGDMNTNGILEFDDVVMLINCVFINLGGSHCLPCLGDMNCDSNLTPADIVALIWAVITQPDLVIKCNQ